MAVLCKTQLSKVTLHRNKLPKRIVTGIQKFSMNLSSETEVITLVKLIRKICTIIVTGHYSDITPPVCKSKSIKW